MTNVKNKQLAFFDHSETLLVISLYPKKGETYSSGTTGVASYTKNVVTHLNRPVVVLADYQKQPQTYQETQALVLRCFKPGKTSMWVELLAVLSQFKKARTVLLQFDFSMYGNMLTSGLLLTFLSVLKVQGFKVSLVSHHVVTDVNKIAGHMGLKNTFIDHIKATIYNFFFKSFYLVLSLVTNQIIVLEEALKMHLQKWVGAEKVLTIPHAVDTELDVVTKSAARKRLGFKAKEQVVMFFGFINWFKGADFFTDTFKNIKTLNNQPARFVLAGGPSATLKSKKYYHDYLTQVEQDEKVSTNLEITGYIPQEEIKDYFAAADLVVFPYRHFMCASGVLSLVFSYQKPFIISEFLGSMFSSSDFKQAMKQADLTRSDISFTLNKKACVTRTEKVLENGLKAKMKHMGQIMSQTRSFKNTAILYDQALFDAPVIAHNDDTRYAYSS